MVDRSRTPFEDTSVSVSRSQEQIRKLLRDAGADGVQFSYEDDAQSFKALAPLKGTDAS